MARGEIYRTECDKWPDPRYLRPSCLRRFRSPRECGRLRRRPSGTCPGRAGEAIGCDLVAEPGDRRDRLLRAKRSPTGSERHARRFQGPVHGMRQSTLGRYALLGCLTASPFVSTTQLAKRCCGKRSKKRLQDRTHTRRSSRSACMTTIARSSRAGVSVWAALRPTRTCGWSLLSGSVTSPAASARSTRKQFHSCGRSRQTTYRGSPGHAW
jgi:hypothetical protein